MGGVAAASPPGEYDVVVVGSGPGGLQTSYFLGRHGVRHAIVSADEGPGGMFRTWPVFQRLLTWTKLGASEEHGSREFERFDLNSLLADTHELRALVAAEMDGGHVLPHRAEMEAGLAAFARKAEIPVRYGCRWTGTRREDGGLVLETTDGEYRCRAAVFALGVTEPWRPPIPGLDGVPHYADLRGADEFAGKRVVVVGKRNSGFELATALLPRARSVTLVSPRSVRAAVLAYATVRAPYLRPLEDHAHGGGAVALDAVVDRIERTAAGYQVEATGTTLPGSHLLEADAVVAATGFTTPLLDLPELGVTTVARGRLPALTPLWESVSVPGVYFAGNATQGAAGLRKHGGGSFSSAVQGFRYNARILAGHLAERLGAAAPERPALERGEVAPLLARELAHGPELWLQKGYLARVVTLDRRAGIRDEGVLPLEHVVDGEGPDAVAVTVEAEADGTIRPGVYTRRGAMLREQALDPHPLQAFDGEAYVRAIESALR